MLFKATKRAKGFSFEEIYHFPGFSLSYSVKDINPSFMLEKHLDNARETSHDGRKTRTYAQLHEHAFQVVAGAFP